MAESEWFAGRSPEDMLRLIQASASTRKVQWFAFACCQTVCTFMSETSRRAVKLIEGLIDGKDDVQAGSSANELAINGREEALRYYYSEGQEGAAAFNAMMAASVAEYAICSVYAASTIDAVISFATLAASKAADTGFPHSAYLTHVEQQVQMLYDIFGNPYHPVAIDPAWLTSNVVSLAQTIYDGRAFDRMLILADALEEVGCTNANILNHCRESVGHVRGCWALDLLLGKS